MREGRTSMSPRSNENYAFFEKLTTYDAVCKVFRGLVTVVGLVVSVKMEGFW